MKYLPSCLLVPPPAPLPVTCHLHPLALKANLSFQNHLLFDIMKKWTFWQSRAVCLPTEMEKMNWRKLRVMRISMRGSWRIGRKKKWKTRRRRNVFQKWNEKNLLVLPSLQCWSWLSRNSASVWSSLWRTLCFCCWKRRRTWSRPLDSWMCERNSVPMRWLIIPSCQLNVFWSCPWQVSTLSFVRFRRGLIV